MGVVVSYWSGELPEVTRLHFLSFRRLNPDTKYVLFLESDASFEGSISELMRLMLKELEIEVRHVALTDLMASQKIPQFSRFKNSFSYSLGRKFLRKLYPIIFKFNLCRNSIHYSELMGFTAGHSFPLTGYVFDLAYRADLFRSLVHQLFTKDDFLYIDLDVCFMKPIDFECASDGLCAQWGTADSGNSAYLLLPKGSSARELIARDLKSGMSALPWILYNSQQLARFGILMLPTKVFDPAWDPSSVIVGRSDLFFRSGFHVETFLNEVNRDCICVHWHNQWMESPDPESPYDCLLRENLNKI